MLEKKKPNKKPIAGGVHHTALEDLIPASVCDMGENGIGSETGCIFHQDATSEDHGRPMWQACHSNGNSQASVPPVARRVHHRQEGGGPLLLSQRLGEY